MSQLCIKHCSDAHQINCWESSVTSGRCSTKSLKDSWNLGTPWSGVMERQITIWTWNHTFAVWITGNLHHNYHRPCNQLWERRLAGISRVIWPVLLHVYVSWSLLLCYGSGGSVARPTIQLVFGRSQVQYLSTQNIPHLNSGCLKLLQILMPNLIMGVLTK